MFPHEAVQDAPVQEEGKLLAHACMHTHTQTHTHIHTHTYPHILLPSQYYNYGNYHDVEIDTDDNNDDIIAFTIF